MGLLKNIFDLADDIVSIPTDLLGLTNHYKKKEAIEYINEQFAEGKITRSEHARLLRYIESQ